LVSYETKEILKETDLETLSAIPYPGIDTIYKALYRNVERIPNNNMLGTRKGDKYEWTTWKQSLQTT